MKNNVLLLLGLILTSSIANGQWGPLVFTDTVSFESPHSTNLRIDTSQSGSIWKVGIPSKTFFNSSYSHPNAIFTDTGYYPNNNYSYFDLIIKDTQYGWFGWGEGILGFWHKYDTDSLLDGGYITVSYDGGNIWKNVINDSIAIWTIPTNFYSSTDTIKGNIPAFSGYNNEWTFSQIYWFWNGLTKDWPQDSLIVRFYFKSDSINNNKEGWLIDHILFNGYQVTGNVNDKIINSPVNIYPNPGRDYFNFTFHNPYSECFKIELFDNLGNLILEKDNIRTNKFILFGSNLNKGVYFYKLFNTSKLFTGKILVK